ncbi:MAG: hypothetical protein OXN89_07205 [Bryobacterales bacterium]|nr:hypothetical protein [Bryobacterales bacterium]
MNRLVAFPFLTLSDAAVEAGPWLLALDGGDPAAAGRFLEHWDQSTTLALQRNLRIDPEIASADLGIPPEDLRLAVVTRVGTGAGRLPRLIAHTDRQQVSPSQPEAQIRLTVRGERLSTVLDLFTEVILAAAPAVRGPLSPGQAGDRLWHHRQRTRLEGEEPRFPLEVVDLRAMRLHAPADAAPWYLDWSPRDWSRDIYGAIRLYLNSSCEEVVQRVESRDPLTLQAILADAMIQVCEALLRQPEAAEIISESEPGSLAAQAGSWLELAWPQQDLDFARAMLETRPSEFRAGFLAIAEAAD